MAKQGLDWKDNKILTNTKHDQGRTETIHNIIKYKNTPCQDLNMLQPKSINMRVMGVQTATTGHCVQLEMQSDDFEIKFGQGSIFVSSLNSSLNTCGPQGVYCQNQNIWPRRGLLTTSFYVPHNIIEKLPSCLTLNFHLCAVSS